MHASVLSGQVKPGRLDDAIDIYKMSILPVLQAQSGFKRSILLCNPDTHQFMMLFFWESLGDLLANEASAYLQAQFHKIRPHCVGLLANEHYVVNIQD